MKSAPLRILTIGGLGRMGRLFSRLLQERGHAVDAIDRETAISRELVAPYDVILIAVSMEAAPLVAATVAPLLTPEQLLFDINSLKQEICDVLAASPAQAVGTHPMFGPTLGSFAGQKIVICRVHDGPLVERMLGEFRDLGADLLEATSAEHDRMMAVVQVLMHFTTFSLGATLEESGIDLRRTLEFTSPIYRLELSLIGRLFAQSPELYREILMRNPYSAEVRTLFRQTVDQIDRMIEDHDNEAFGERFERNKRFFDHFADDAMALSDRIISDVLVPSRELKKR